MSEKNTAGQYVQGHDSGIAGRLAEKLGHSFKNRGLLELALTHSSWANEAGHGEMHNERLEFLGDAVLELCVTSELYARFPKAREGDMTGMRSSLVSEASLAAIAREIGIERGIRLGVGEERQGGRNRDAILADALEAVLAAVYKDGGFHAAQDAVRRLFASRWPARAARPKSRDYKSRLQEASQRLFRNCPVYALEGSSGPEHAKIFSVCLSLPDGRQFRASNSSCKKAEQDAAASALEALLASP